MKSNSKKNEGNSSKNGGSSSNRNRQNSSQNGGSSSRRNEENSSEGEDNPLKELFIEELKDIYWAEKKLTKAIPKMVKAATNEDLITALENHLTETENQVERLEKVFELVGEEAKAKKCDGMEGIVTEGEEMMAELKDSPALDAVIIAGAQKVEHYEIASYGTLKAYATQLGLDEAAEILEEILDEEKAADKKLTELSEVVNVEAEGEGEEEEETTASAN